MEPRYTKRRNNFTVAGEIRLDYETGRLLIGGRDLIQLIQERQQEAVVETAGGGERTPTACSVTTDFLGS